jgi:hypothetical protein
VERDPPSPSPPRPTASSDIVERHDDGLGAQLGHEAPQSSATSPLDGSTLAADARAWVVTTFSGSRYIVVRASDGQWWFGGKNRSNRTSVPPPPRLYPIEAPSPWPPVLGLPLVMVVPRRLAFTDPERAPGGGKVTSAVQLVEELSLRAALQRVEGHDGN